jgi:hydrogenase nickel incorporation protein HypB
MAIRQVPIVENIMDANAQVAAIVKNIFDAKGLFAINLMASPGAGKTTLILETIKQLNSKIKIGVIEGDTAPVTIDSDKVQAAGMPAVQINTGGGCHLDAVMLLKGIEQLPLDELDLVIVENIEKQWNQLLFVEVAFAGGETAADVVLITGQPTLSFDRSEERR